MTCKKTYKQPIDLEAEYNRQQWVALLFILSFRQAALQSFSAPIRVLPGW